MEKVKGILIALSLWIGLITLGNPAHANVTMANTEANTVDKKINNVKVSISDNKVRVTLDNKHVFSQDCKDYTCKLFTPLLPDPYIEREDGYIVESAVIKQVSVKNAPSFRRFNDSIVFIVNKASVSGLYSHIGHYAIDTFSGSVTVNISEQDVYAHGLPDPKKSVAQETTSTEYGTVSF